MTPWHYVLAFALAFFALGQAQPQPGLVVTADVQPLYRQGEAGRISFDILLEDPAATVAEGVLFLNIVERDAARKWPQAAHLIFGSAREEEGVFRVPYTGQHLRAGLRTTLSFKLRDRAKIGDYALVVQLYRGDVTDPGRVRVADRVAMQGFDFSIAEPDSAGP